MSTYTATICWTRSGEGDFTKGQYSRAHEWAFDGGAVIPASSSPHVMPVPMSDAALQASRSKVPQSSGVPEPVGVDLIAAWTGTTLTIPPAMAISRKTSETIRALKNIDFSLGTGVRSCENKCCL